MCKRQRHLLTLMDLNRASKALLYKHKTDSRISVIYTLVYNVKWETEARIVRTWLYHCQKCKFVYKNV